MLLTLTKQDQSLPGKGCVAVCMRGKKCCVGCGPRPQTTPMVGSLDLGVCCRHRPPPIFNPCLIHVTVALFRIRSSMSAGDESIETTSKLRIEGPGIGGLRVQQLLTLSISLSSMRHVVCGGLPGLWAGSQPFRGMLMQLAGLGFGTKVLSWSNESMID